MSRKILFTSLPSVARDYDGDGKIDQAVYRDGMWFICAYPMVATPE